ncbi:KH domain-containing protein akap-1 [Trichonephila clavipes]|nr:KH domain-containing protein akap-1 [Trichonephila clavipes]
MSYRQSSTRAALYQLNSTSNYRNFFLVGVCIHTTCYSWRFSQPRGKHILIVAGKNFKFYEFVYNNNLVISSLKQKTNRNIIFLKALFLFLPGIWNELQFLKAFRLEKNLAIYKDFDKEENMKYKKNNSNNPKPVTEQASCSNQTCNTTNQSKRRKNKNNQNGRLETMQNKINESKNDQNIKVIEVENGSTETVQETENSSVNNTELGEGSPVLNETVQETENSSVNNTELGEGSPVLKDSTNGILAINVSNNCSDSTSTFSSLSVSPANSIVENMKYKKNNSNNPKPVTEQASGSNQTCNTTNKSKRRKNKNNQNGRLETMQNKINESKNDQNIKVIEVENGSTETVQETENSSVNNTELGEGSPVLNETVQETENSSVNNTELGEGSPVLKDSQTNGILAINVSNNCSDSTSTFSSLSVSPANSIVENMKYKKNNSNNPKPVTEQASGSNQTCNTTNKSKRRKNKNNQNGRLETMQNKINESKNDQNIKVIEVKNGSTETVQETENSSVNNTELGEGSPVLNETVQETENSSVNNTELGEGSPVLKDSQTNGILAINVSNNCSDSTSTFSSLSVSPANSIVDCDNKSFENACDELSSEKMESKTVECLIKETKKFQFPSPSKVGEFIPKSYKSNEEPLTVDVGSYTLMNYHVVRTHLDTVSNAPNLSEVSVVSPTEPESPVESEDSGLPPSVQDPLQDFACGEPESLQDEVITYSFEICALAVGRLIGKRGKFVNYINEQTGAVVLVVNHPLSMEDKLCNIQGTSTQVTQALDLIIKRFPQDQYRGFSVERYTYPPIMVQFPESFRLKLPPGIMCEIQICKVISPSQFFVRIPTHPSFFTLWSKNHEMNRLYNDHSPKLEYPEIGHICVIKSSYGWVRAEIIQMLPESDECILRLCDFGGYERVSNSSLFMIHAEFMDHPFQAIESCLADIEPADGENWNVEGRTFLEGMSGGIIYAFAVGHSNTGAQALRLHKKMSDLNYMNINGELVGLGIAKLISPPEIPSSVL